MAGVKSAYKDVGMRACARPAFKRKRIVTISLTVAEWGRAAKYSKKNGRRCSNCFGGILRDGKYHKRTCPECGGTGRVKKRRKNGKGN